MTRYATAIDAPASRARGGEAGRGKTHCRHNHEYTPENTYLNERGHRRCRICQNAAVKRHYRQNADRIKESKQARVDCRCEECGAGYTLSARVASAKRKTGSRFLCDRCRFPVEQQQTDDIVAWARTALAAMTLADRRLIARIPVDVRQGQSQVLASQPAATREAPAGGATYAAIGRGSERRFDSAGPEYDPDPELVELMEAA